MAHYVFGKLTIDPSRNPAVLDTATWDQGATWERVRSTPAAAWAKAFTSLSEGPCDVSVEHHASLFAGSRAQHGGTDWVLGRLSDGQYVLFAKGADPGHDVPHSPLGQRALPDGSRLAAFPADAEVVDWFVRAICPGRGPVALGAIPRLGIGTRMSRAVWPGVWPALARTGLAANTIQNSVRELNILADLLAGRPALDNYMFGFGALYEGHTGSTFEGLWLAGVLAALESDCRARYGADADHIMVKRTPGGLDRAKRVIDSAQRYTFFTLDVSDVLDYNALDPNSRPDLAALIPSPQERRDLIAFHSDKGRIAGPMAEQALAKMVAKHGRALSAVADLAEHVRKLKHGDAFDLELSIDETPPGVKPLDCTTTEEEMRFLLAEIRRRALPVTHIAPNFGVEKGLDYQGKDGLDGLERRIRGLHRLASEQGILLDCHSGDDLGSETRRAVGRGADGKIHFKISPMLQELFARVLHKVCPDRFVFWWEDTMAYARREAEKGSDLAAKCLKQYEGAGAERRPSPAHALFHYYGFATVGRRDARGQFIHRDKFYALPADFGEAYSREVTALLGEVIGDVFRPNG